MGCKSHAARLLLALSFGLAGAAFGETRPAVLELFTSQGCSSCPAAEALVNLLARRPGVLALSFHVDYWDDLGWHDRYSLASATERQQRYAHALKRSSVYTPQFIVDGWNEIAGGRGSVTEALSGPRDGVSTSVLLKGGVIEVHVGGATDATAADVVLLGYLRDAITPIGRGENAGRTLQESNIVVFMRELGRWKGKPQDFSMPAASLPGNVTDVAVLVQSASLGPVVGAAAQAIR